MTEKDQLRRQAEALISPGADAAAAALSLAEARQVLHELRVHQIELEMQNEELRRAQTELDAARARYFDLYDLAPVGYCTVSEQGLILEANLTAATLLGVARGTLIKKHFSLSILNEDRDLYYRRQKQFFATRAASFGQASKTLSLELRMLKKDGSPVWVNLASRLAEDAGGAPVCHIAIVDISERKRVENVLLEATRQLAQATSKLTNIEAIPLPPDSGNAEIDTLVGNFNRMATALQESEEQFRAMFQMASIGIAQAEVQTGRWLRVNPKMCTITGYTAAELLQMRVSEITHPQDRAKDWEAFQRVVRGEAADYRLEKRYLRKDGMVVWVNVNMTVIRDAAGQPARTMATIEDITERKRMEEALRESEDRFARLAEQSGTVIWEVDAQGLYEYVSPVVEKVLGYRPDELTGRMHFYDLHPESSREVFKAEAFAIFQRKDSFAGFVNAAQTKDGRVAWVISTGMPVLNADGSLRGYRGSNTDITARKQADEELQKLQKLQSVGTLAGGIAHDFNNIMVGVFGNISLAKDELTQDHPGHPLLEEAEKSMDRAVRLTTQLLTFAKGGDPIKENVSLGTLVEEIARFDLAGSAVKLVYQQAPELWLAVVDKGQMQQAISNLTINARQAMPEGGSLHITLANADVSDPAMPGLCPGKYVQITMRDEGAGIDPKNIERIFDPYFTTKQSGNGLGLATAYSIITKHGGHIEVTSAFGRGTTFTIYLPASGSPLRAEAVPPAAAVPPLDRPAKILVMDDEDIVRRLVGRVLTRRGFTVVTAPGGQEAIALYQQAMTDGAPFDVVIMDLTIPGGIGGKDAIKELLAIDPHAKAIVSSGYADDPVMAHYADYGFKGVVAKPYTAGELRAVLARILK